jgi:Holliday junction resolvase YEN1
LPKTKTHLLYNSPPADDGKDGRVVVYRAEDIRTHPSIKLGPADLLLVALLAGGDYSVCVLICWYICTFPTLFQNGLHGCGLLTAINLAHAGYGQKLVNGISSTPSEEIPVFLAAWRKEIASELRTNCSGFLEKCHPYLV